MKELIAGEADSNQILALRKLKFTVLMSVYSGDTPSWFHDALASINAQTFKPDELILIQDGPVSSEISNVIERFSDVLPLRLHILPENRGLSAALQLGVANSSNEWIARMDSDDLALPDRFEKQFQFLMENPGVDVLGSWISEFEAMPENICGYRRPPAESKELHRYARSRCPLNHMTVIYKKSAVLSVGGYEGFRGIEDYYLWAKLICAGYCLANFPECLVNVRGGRSVAVRRGGISYVQIEARLYIKLYKMGFMSLFSALLQFLLRLPLRLITSARVLAYKSIRKE